MERKFAYNYVQDPTSQQGFNRYAYCFYNPLKYVDPTGERCYGPSWVDLARMCDDWVMEQKRAAFQMGLTMVESHLEEATRFASLLFYNWGDGGSSGSGNSGGGSGVDNGYGGKGGWCRDKYGNMTYNPDATTSTEGFLGVTYKDNETNTYYGLFGSTYDLATENGRFCQACDQAIINYAEYVREITDGGDSFERRTYFGDVAEYLSTDELGFNTDNIHRSYDYNGGIGVLARCENDYNMWLSFEGWSTSMTLQPILTNNFSHSTTFPSGYPIFFGSSAGQSAFVIFPSPEIRNNVYNKYKRIFGCP